MFAYYKKEGRQLVEVDKAEKGCWINVYPPFNHEHLKTLSEELNIPLDYLIDSLDIDERSRFEEEEGVKLIVLKCSVLNELESESDPPYITIPLGIIYTEDIIITISAFENPIINSFLRNVNKNFDPSNKEHFILKIFERTVYYFLHHLQDINNKRNLFEKELYNSMRNQELNKLMNIQKSLVYFVTSLRINELMMIKIKRLDFLKIKEKEEESDLLEDIVIDNGQALEMSNIYTNILNGTMNALASVISNNLNLVMKRLTSVTIILMVPTLVASFYGMNVALPFEDAPNAFIYTLVISLMMSILLVSFFLRKKWF